MKRRLERKREKSADHDYYVSKSVQRESAKFSRESLQLFESIDKGQRLANQIEFQFAA